MHRLAYRPMTMDSLYILRLKNPPFSTLYCHFQKLPLIFLINNILCFTPCLSSSYPPNTPVVGLWIRRLWVILAWVPKLPRLLHYTCLEPFPLYVIFVQLFFFLKGLHPHLFLLNTTLLIFFSLQIVKGASFFLILCPSLITMEIYLRPAWRKYLIKM